MSLVGVFIVSHCFTCGIENNCDVKIVREKETIGEGRIVSLQQNMKDVREVAINFECGLKIETEIKLVEGDSLECYKKEEIVRKLK